MQPTRISLLDRLRSASDGLAWEDFYRTYAEVILRYARKRGLDDSLAEDVLQETMVDLIRILPGFQYDPKRGLFRNFLFTLAHRKSLAAHRRARRRGETSFDAPAFEDGLAPADTIPDPGTAEPGAGLDRNWEESLRETAWQRVCRDPEMTGRTLEVFRAYVLDQEPAAAVATRFGMKENAVYQIKNRVIRRLRAEVEGLRGVGDERRLTGTFALQKAKTERLEGEAPDEPNG